MEINQTALVLTSLVLLVLVIMGNRALGIYQKVHNLQTTPSFEELIKTLELILATEISIYERYMANSTDAVDLDGFITNAQFKNIYNDLSNRVIRLISPQFYEYMECYWTEEEIHVYISQRIYTYLAEKAVPPDDEVLEEDEDEMDEEGQDLGDKDDSFYI